MANNRWDFSDILLQQRAGQIMGQAYAGLGQQAGTAFKDYAQQKKENQAMKGEVDSAANFFESATDMVQKKADAEMQANGGKLSDETFKLLQATQQTLGGLHDPNRSLVERNAMAKSASKNLFDLINLGSATQSQRQAELNATLTQQNIEANQRKAETERQQSANIAALSAADTETKRGGGIGVFTNQARASLSNPVTQGVLEAKRLGVSVDDYAKLQQANRPTAVPFNAKQNQIQADVNAWQQGHPNQKMDAATLAQITRSATDSNKQSPLAQLHQERATAIANGADKNVIEQYDGAIRRLTAEHVFAPDAFARASDNIDNLDKQIAAAKKVGDKDSVFKLQNRKDLAEKYLTKISEQKKSIADVLDEAANVTVEEEKNNSWFSFNKSAPSLTPTSNFKSANEVRAAFRNKKISPEEAKRIIESQFPEALN